MRKGIGPRALGSPLKQTKGVMLDEVTVTGKLPSKKPSFLETVKYSVVTGTGGNTWKSKQHPSMVRHSYKPITGSPPMLGGAKVVNLGKGAVEGFNVMKSAASTPKVAKAAEYIGEALEITDLFKKKKKKKKKK